MLVAVAANYGFKLASVDIRAAFLQSKVLDREVFIAPPSDVKKKGCIWKFMDMKLFDTLMLKDIYKEQY